jgi:AcrR family transcriptional regulator
MNDAADGSDRKTPGRRDANARATRDAIIAAARAAFAANGFAGTALEDIVRDAGITTGALYHHFGNKKGLFRAVAESIEQEILEQVAAGLPAGKSPWQQLEYGITSALELCAHPDVRRILFSDAPTVIGVREWREIELRYGFGLMRELLQQLEQAGEIHRGSVDLAAQVLLGAVIEAVHAVALADDPARATEQARAMLMTFVRALRLNR